jgi:hypothetical protein
MGWAAKAVAMSLMGMAMLTGCSDKHDVGQLPGAEGVEEVPPAIGAAMAIGDGSKACSLMSANFQNRLVAKLRAKNCPDSIALAAGTLSTSDKSWLRAMTVEDIKVTGSNATGRIARVSAVPTAVRSLFGSENLTFRNEFERWELDGVSP